MQSVEQYVAQWLIRLCQLRPAFRTWCMSLTPQQLHMILTAWEPLLLLELPQPPGGKARFFAEGLLTQLTQQPRGRFGQAPPVIVMADIQLAPASQSGHVQVQPQQIQRLQRQLQRQRWAVAPTCYPRDSHHISVEAVFGVLYKADLPPADSTQSHAVYRIFLLQPEGGPANVFFAFAAIYQDLLLPLANMWHSKIVRQPSKEPANLAETQEKSAYHVWEDAKAYVGGNARKLLTDESLLSEYAAGWAHDAYGSLLDIFKAELAADLQKAAPGLRPWWEHDQTLWPIALRQSGLLQQQHDAWGAKV
jgi:hypothetical protein